VLSPVMREHLSRGEEVVQEAMVEHGGAKKALATMSSLSGDDPLLDAKMAELMGGSATTSRSKGEMLPSCEGRSHGWNWRISGRGSAQPRNPSKASVEDADSSMPPWRHSSPWLGPRIEGCCALHAPRWAGVGL
jgi:hypothetical protein